MKEIDMKVFRKLLYRKFNKKMPEKKTKKFQLISEKDTLKISIIVTAIALIIMLINIYIFYNKI